MLSDRGTAELPDAERTVAQVAVAQAEFADLVVHTGTADAWDRARVDAVLARLAPAGPTTSTPPAARAASPGTDCGVRLLLFSARRPFHPERLHRAIDVLLDGVVRSRGRIWLATRPGAVRWL